MGDDTSTIIDFGISFIEIKDHKLVRGLINMTKLAEHPGLALFVEEYLRTARQRREL